MCIKLLFLATFLISPVVFQYWHSSYLTLDGPSRRPASPHILPILTNDSTINTNAEAKCRETSIPLFH